MNTQRLRFLTPVPLDPKRFEVENYSYFPQMADLLASFPVFEDDDPDSEDKARVISVFMNLIADRIQKDYRFLMNERDFFWRIILGTTAEDPFIAVSLLPTGFQTRIHGHKAGYMFERMLKGSIQLERFDLDKDNFAQLRSVENIHSGQIITDDYKPELVNGMTHASMIHRITALEPSVILHYIPDTFGQAFEQKLSDNETTRLD